MAFRMTAAFPGSVGGCKIRLGRSCTTVPLPPPRFAVVAFASCRIETTENPHATLAVIDVIVDGVAAAVNASAGVAVKFDSWDVDAAAAKLSGTVAVMSSAPGASARVADIENDSALVGESSP